VNLTRLTPQFLKPKARVLLRATELRSWHKRNFSSPVPQSVKWAVLARYGELTETWVETGTYQGETTAFLAQTAKKVYTVEPSTELAKNARKRLRGFHNVTILEGKSEDLLSEIIERVDGPLSFWLDAHYSGGTTFKGTAGTPIREELALIQKHILRLDRLTVLIDDMHSFEPSDPMFADYPTRGWLVDWANSNKLNWTMEHGIFVAWK